MSQSPQRTKSQRRRSRRKRKQKALAVTLDESMVIAYADGKTTLMLRRKDVEVFFTPTKKDPRRDVFVYHPGTIAILGLTALMQINGWKLCIP